MEKKISVGVIGCGKIAESNHLPALLNTPGVKVEWLFDKSEHRSGLLSEMYGIPVTDASMLTKKLPETDICLLTIPYGVRKSYIPECAEAGVGLYVEKPFATTVSEHLQYCDLFPDHKLAIGFQRRYYKTITIVQQIIDGNLFGELNSIKFSQGYFQLKGGSGFMADAAISGGGVIIESGIHTLDQIIYMTRAVDVSVSEAKFIERKGIDYDSSFIGKLTTAKKTIDIACHISSLRNLDNGIDLVFEKASIRFFPFPDSPIRVLNNHGGSFVINELTPGTSAATNVNAAFVLFWKDFIESVTTGIPNPTSGRSSLLTTKWVEAVYQKMKKA